MSQTDSAFYKEATDENLILRFQEGDKEAYVQIVNRYKNRLVNFLFRYTGDYDEAEDIAQDTFLKVYTSKELYKEIAKFSTWMYTIAINYAKTRKSKSIKYKTYSLSNINEQSDHEFELPDESFTPDINADSKIQNKIIQEALMKLSEKYRKLVILRDIDELSYEEICDITKLPMGTVKSRINRGREKLQILLQHIYKS